MQLFYREYGEGHPLLITHGLYGSSDNWVTIGKALAKYFHVYIIDQRNHGQSPHSPEMNYEVLSADLAEFIETHQLKKVSLLGHSMGGKTAMFYACQNPGKVSNLLVADISPRSYDTNPETAPQLKTHKQIIGAMQAVDFTQVKNRQDINEQLAQKLPNERIRGFLMKNVKRMDTGEYGWRIHLEAIANHLVDVLKGLDVDTITRNGGIEAFPALFIRGELSDYIGPEDEPLIKQLFPYARVATIPGTGHWLHAEKPREFIDTIKEFIF